jgi:hypothetical protein
MDELVDQTKFFVLGIERIIDGLTPEKIATLQKILKDLTA